MNFKANLNGIKFKELALPKKEKEEKKLFNERLELVQNKIKIVYPYFQKFIDEIYNPNITVEDELSSSINIFNYLEEYGTYLLSSTDVKDRLSKNINKSSTEYDKILTQKSTKYHSNFDVSISSLAEPNTTIYVNTETTITEEDFNNKEYGLALREYKKAKDYWVKKMLVMQNRIESNGENNTKKESLNNLIGAIADLNQDMKTVKQYHTENVQYGIKSKKSYYISPSYKLDIIDYTNPKHISAIIKNIDLFQDELIMDNPISEISFDITNAIKNLHKNKVLNDNEMSLLNLVNSTSLNFEQIGFRLNVSRKTVYNRFNNIVQKICNYNKNKEGNLIPSFSHSFNLCFQPFKFLSCFSISHFIYSFSHTLYFLFF